MKKVFTVVVGAPVLVVAGLVAVLLYVSATDQGPFGSGLAAGSIVPSPAAGASVPATMLLLYQQAAGACPGLAWTLLAAIGTVESQNGTSQLPGVRSGANAAGAEGPMQFEPATFARYDRPVPPGGANPPNPYDPSNAVYAAARYLCALGAPADAWSAAIAYNCGNTGPACQVASAAYASEVLGLATQLADASSDTGVLALDYAESQVGVPYRWGGEAPGTAFDCSGLTQWAYGQAGINLPRTAQDQYDAGPLVPLSAPLEPGDLVFFGQDRQDVEHVGIYVGSGFMIDAPHTGADVREEDFPATPGASWGSETYLGATRPADGG